MFEALLLFAMSGSPVVDPELPRLEEQVRVRRVRLPIYATPSRKNACRDLSASAIKISEDGLDLEVLHLDAARMPAEHALLIDTSESMLDRLSEVKLATVAYASSLPSDEPALVASFDDDLILHAPMSVDRLELRRRVMEMGLGWRTHLWDATAVMIDYLESRRRRAVMIVLSDGCDTDTDSDAGFDRVLEVASRSVVLTVYAIGLGLPARCPDSTLDPRTALKDLARVTGGDYIDIDSPSEMQGVLEQIRERLKDERVVSYAPPAFGSGPKDRADRATQRWRRIRVTLEGVPHCRVRSAAGTLRLETAAGARPDPAPPIFEYDPRAGLIGKPVDVLHDRGILSRRDPTGAVRLAEFAERTSEVREVGAPVPPLSRVAWPGAIPEYALFLALMQWTPEAAGLGLPAVEAGIAGWTAAPFLINGRTLLAERTALGVALAGHPEYRDWAMNQLRARRLEELELLERENPDAADLSALGAVREYLSGPEWQPRSDELAPYLSEWLGDISALRLHRAAEAWLTQRFVLGVRRSGGQRPPAEWIARSESLWRDIGLLLSEHRAVRIFGLLVPGYSPERDRIGFYRIVLPRPTTLLNAWHLSPDAPRGMRLLEWALADPQFAEAFAAAPFGVTAVRYTPVPRAPEILELAGLPVPIGETSVNAIRVQVELEVDGARGERATLSAIMVYRPYAGVSPGEPLCVEIDPDAARGSRGAQLVRALVEAKAASELPCVVERGLVDPRPQP